MGFGDAMKGAMDTTREYQLSREMTIEEVFELLQGANLSEDVVGKFELKKGLMGKNIVFNGGTEAVPTLSVKGSKAKLQKVTKSGGSSSVSIGGFKIPKGGMKAEMNKAEAGNAYFAAVGNALTEILK